MYLVLVSAHRLYQAQMIKLILYICFLHSPVNVVVGFLNNSFSGVEQGPGHSAPVGYKKGSGSNLVSNLVFNVGNIPGSGPDGASEFTIIM